MYTKYLTLWPLGGPQCEPCEDFRDFLRYSTVFVSPTLEAIFGIFADFGATFLDEA
jgi:hypothetical protein